MLIQYNIAAVLYTIIYMMNMLSNVPKFPATAGWRLCGKLIPGIMS